MLWAHQGPQSKLVSTVGVWHLTLCRASFWTMQTASKELNRQEKQSEGQNHSSARYEINVELTYPSGEHRAWCIRVSYATFLWYKQQLADGNIQERPNAANGEKEADSYRNNDPEPRHRDTSDGALLPMRDVSEPLERLSVQFITSLKYL